MTGTGKALSSRMVGASVLCLMSMSANAEDMPFGYSFYGMPGLIDMPSANVAPDAEIIASFGAFEQQQRLTFAFQITPQLTGAFRYARIDENRGPGTQATYDRSFDLHYQLFDETDTRPAVAIGLRDFLGTGIYSSEYVVATKTFADTFRVTGGIGWGRLGSYNGFTNPLGIIDPAFETRPTDRLGPGGVPTYNRYFRGDAAFFGGVEWQVFDDLTLIAEYSSDAYAREVGRDTLTFNSPLNFGLRYQIRPGMNIGAYYLRGTEVGVTATFNFNPTERLAPSGLEQAPFPVSVRAEDAQRAASWDQTPANEQTLITGTTQALALDGFVVDGIELEQRAIRVRYTNTSYRTEAQGAGHVARILTALLPPSIETFILEPMRSGVPVSSVSVQRTDIEVFENEPNAAQEIFDRAIIGEADLDGMLTSAPSDETAFNWGISPYVDATLFDGENPVLLDYGIEAKATYHFAPNIVLAGVLKYEFGGDSDAGAISDSALPPVRSEGSLYGADGGVLLDSLALHWYGRPAEDLYSRVSLGYLEPMFAGVSTEVLWKPVDSRLALGAELNYVIQRDFDMGFGFREFDSSTESYGLDGTYETLSGHVSAYYQFNNGFRGRIDVGRYLAQDWGATVALDRTFDNGWQVGAYATFTDVSFEDFGEGSFDKGIYLTIPTDWVTGNATNAETNATISSLQRDGGARLRLDGRLYENIYEGHGAAFEGSWGRFWR